MTSETSKIKTKHFIEKERYSSLRYLTYDNTFVFKEIFIAKKSKILSFNDISNWFSFVFQFFFRNLKFNENEETKPTNRKGSKLFKLNHERKCDETRESKQLEENKKMCYLVLYIFQF